MCIRVHRARGNKEESRFGRFRAVHGCCEPFHREIGSVSLPMEDSCYDGRKNHASQTLSDITTLADRYARAKDRFTDRSSPRHLAVLSIQADMTGPLYRVCGDGAWETVPRERATTVAEVSVRNRVCRGRTGNVIWVGDSNRRNLQYREDTTHATQGATENWTLARRFLVEWGGAGRVCESPPQPDTSPFFGGSPDSGGARERGDLDLAPSDTQPLPPATPQTDQ